MTTPCIISCVYKNRVKAESTGVRGKLFDPSGVSYKGYWLNSKKHLYGVQEDNHHLIYDGNWKNGKRDGYGVMRKASPHKKERRIYIGNWCDDMKCGEGKRFFKNGTYYGFWHKNTRHGHGIMWYRNGSLYMGEWRTDVYHGKGVLFYANGNRYEGHFARGFKNGEGTFYHMHTGQTQKGMWHDDVCKSSIISDEFRNQVRFPTMYPIPKIGLDDPDQFICELFRQYMKNANKPIKSFVEYDCLKLAKRKKKYAEFEPLTVPRSKIPCLCNYPERAPQLREP